MTLKKSAAVKSIAEDAACVGNMKTVSAAERAPPRSIVRPTPVGIRVPDDPARFGVSVACKFHDNPFTAVVFTAVVTMFARVMTVPEPQPLTVQSWSL